MQTKYLKKKIAEIVSETHAKEMIKCKVPVPLNNIRKPLFPLL